MTVMVDWFKGVVRGLPHAVPIFGGRMISVRDDGTIEYDVAKRRQVRGSHESTLMVRSVDNESIEIDGNPVKFFQGHNLFGSDDLPALVEATVRALAPLFALTIPLPWDPRRAGTCSVKRVDLNEGYQLRDSDQVNAAIRCLDVGGRLSHRGRGTVSGGSTIYFGQGSRRWSLKAYNKLVELLAKGHRLPDALRLSGLLEYANGLLRFEVTLRALELADEKLDDLSHWGQDVAEATFRRYLARLQIADEMTLSADDIEGLPSRLRVAYLAWRDGHDLQLTLPRRTFYRYRSELREHGVDIAVVNERNVERTSLRLVLTAKPVGVPAWARGTPLYFDPALALAA